MFFDNEWNVAGAVVAAMMFVFLIAGSWIGSRSMKKVKECKKCMEDGYNGECRECRLSHSSIFIGRLLICVALGLGLLAYIVFYQPYVESEL